MKNAWTSLDHAFIGITGVLKPPFEEPTIYTEKIMIALANATEHWLCFLKNNEQNDSFYNNYNCLFWIESVLSIRDALSKLSPNP